MSPTIEASSASPLEILAGRGFSRVASAHFSRGNAARILLDGPENYTAWLNAIAAADRSVHLENYIVDDDRVGRSFAEAMIAAAGRGVRARILYDWFGCWSRTPSAYWRDLRQHGVEIRCYNPPRFGSPVGWISRDHRKLLTVDGEIAFAGGLCIGQAWEGDPARGVAPWRDTGIEIRGPAVAHLEAAFMDSWAAAGPALPAEDATATTIAPAGDLNLLVIPGSQDGMGLYRLEQLIADLAERSLWLTDAYFVASTAYVRALSDAARSGVDVRLLVPGSSDAPVIQTLSRSGYRPLLEAGVRVFEWNGPMLHAKTAVADGSLARIGSSNSNLASWIINRELDVTIADADFAGEMARIYERDLESATEIVLRLRRVRAAAPEGAGDRRPRRARAAGASRLVAGAVGFGSAVNAAIGRRRPLGASESRVLAAGGALALVIALAALLLPAVIAYPFALAAIWGAATLFGRAWRLRTRSGHG